MRWTPLCVGDFVNLTHPSAPAYEDYPARLAPRGVFITARFTSMSQLRTVVATQSPAVALPPEAWAFPVFRNTSANLEVTLKLPPGAIGLQNVPIYVGVFNDNPEASTTMPAEDRFCAKSLAYSRAYLYLSLSLT